MTILGFRVARDTLIKSKMPPGGGWMPIPNGKHGGFRRRKGQGWEYWYPSAGKAIQAHKENAAQADRHKKVVEQEKNKAQQELFGASAKQKHAEEAHKEYSTHAEGIGAFLASHKHAQPHKGSYKVDPKHKAADDAAQVAFQGKALPDGQSHQDMIDAGYEPYYDDGDGEGRVIADAYIKHPPSQYPSAVAEVVVPGRHHLSRTVGTNAQGEATDHIPPEPDRDESYGTYWDEDDIFYELDDDDIVAEYDIDRDDHDLYWMLNDDAYNQAIDDKKRELTEDWINDQDDAIIDAKAEAEENGEEFDVHAFKEQWQKENPAPTIDDAADEVDEEDYMEFDEDLYQEAIDDAKREKAVEIADERFEAAREEYLDLTYDVDVGEYEWDEDEVPVEQLTDAVKALQKEIEVRKKVFYKSYRNKNLPDRGEVDRTIAEMAVLNALHLFTAASVDTCRNPDNYDSSEGREKIGQPIGNWESINGDEEQYDEAHHVLKALADAPCEPTKVYRGMGLNTATIDHLTPPPEGAEIDLRGMASFSTDPSVARGFAPSHNGAVILEMETVKGTKVHDVSGYPEEKEFLVGGKVRVKEVIRREGQKTRVIVENVLDDVEKSEKKTRGPIDYKYQKMIDEELNKPHNPKKKFKLKKRTVDPNYWRSKGKKDNKVKKSTAGDKAVECGRHRIHMSPPPSPNREVYPFVGTLWCCGVPVHVENVPGSIRRGYGWRTKMKAYYGEIPGTLGPDGDPIDVFVNPKPVVGGNVYVIQQLDPETNAYDEDKVMLGYGSEADAKAEYCRHYDYVIDKDLLSCLTFTTAEFGHKIFIGNDTTDGMPLFKSAKPTGKGWMPIPGGKKGGYRRPKPGAGKRWEYWYPDQGGIDHSKATVDAGRSYKDLKPGEMVMVGGRQGLYRWTPEHGKSGEGRTWVTSEVTGEHEIVRTETLMPVKEKKKLPKKKRRKPPKGVKKPPKGVKKPRKRLERPKVPPAPPQGEEEPSASARMVPVFKGSTAKEGTFLHAIENGKLMVKEYKDRDRNGRMVTHKGVHVPQSMQRKFLKEMDGVVHGAARKIAKTYGIRIHDGQGPTQAYESMVSAGRLGLVMALTRYQGQGPFVPFVQDYARGQIAAAVRSELGVGAKVSDHAMRMLGTFYAARSQAGAGASDTKIAKTWRLKKRDVFQGRLPTYTVTKEDGSRQVVDQGAEEVPHGSWRVVSENGKEIGDPHAGKLKLIDQMRSIAEGSKPNGSDWLMEHAIPVASETMTAVEAAGTAAAVQEVLDDMDPAHTIVLRGLYMTEGDEAPKTVTELAKELDLKGRNGKPASKATAARKVKQIKEQAVKVFKQKYKAAHPDLFSMINGFLSVMQGSDLPAHAYGPSHRELENRFGSTERVRIYQAAMRANKAEDVARVLEAEKRGEASASESRKIRKDYHDQIDKERQEAFNRHSRTTTVGTTGSYGAEAFSLHDYLHSIAKTGRA